MSFTTTLNEVYGETWKIQIPAGSAEINARAHYLPSEISVRPGDKVEWGNADSEYHTVTSGTLEMGSTGIFDSGFIDPGSKYTEMFDEEDIGEIKYFCRIHPWMIGIINVVDLDIGFQVFHNIGSDVSKFPIDMPYKVQRNLVDVKVDTVRKSLTFDFVGKINNDKFVAYLSEDLIKNPQAVWINDKQTTNYEITTENGISIFSIILSDHAQQVKVVGVDVIGKFDPKDHILVNQIQGITDKIFYEQGDEIVVSGIVQNPVQISKISLDIVSPKDVIIYHKEIPLTAHAKFTETIPTIGTLHEFGEYGVKITAPDAKNAFLSFTFGVAPNEFPSPLKQMKSGIDAENVLCNEGLELFVKKSNGKAICLRESTAEILMKRDWI
ncbi:MAG: hypothetical protein K5777_05650 [Nitrosopumilus sp.]|nr:hypothetical protein [Nitrosopumilus sp.]